MKIYIYWKEQCKYCVNNRNCQYEENKEAIKSLMEWEEKNRFWGTLKLTCDYFYLDEDKYAQDNENEECGNSKTS